MFGRIEIRQFEDLKVKKREDSKKVGIVKTIISQEKEARSIKNERVEKIGSRSERNEDVEWR
jgi:hypothetical protein